LTGLGALLVIACSFPDVTFSNDSGTDGTLENDAIATQESSGDDGGPASDANLRRDRDAEAAEANPRVDGSNDATSASDARADAAPSDSGMHADGGGCDCGADAMYPTNSCQLLSGSCGSPGFQAPLPCGATGTFVTVCTPVISVLGAPPVGCTVTSTAQRVQECR
jgi:hypothetical protein